MKTKLPFPNLWFRTNALRACLEAAPISIGTLLMFCWISPMDLDPYIPLNLIAFMMPIVCALWCVMRIRKPTGSWWKQIAKEIGIALLTTAILLAISLPFMALGDQYPPPYYVLLFLTSFAVFRASIRFLEFWNPRRRKSFATNLTHFIFMTILIIALVIVGIFSALVAPGVGPPPTTATEGIIRSLENFFAFWFTTSVVAGAISLLFVLPPALLFSYWVARGFTGRVDALAQATSEMRQGNYSVRVPVQGEDEVAQLQSNFNTMASDLDRTLRELQTERDRVTNILQSRRDLVAGVSHDLRTPVAIIRAHLELARHVKSPSSLEAELNILEREIMRLENMINDLFALSQADVNRLTLDLKSIDTRTVVRDRVAAMAPLAWQSGRVQVASEVTADAPRAIADRMRLEQALTNLIHNATRHTPPGGIVMVSVSAEENAVRIDVRDTGEGISPNDLPLIWDRYYRGKNGPSSPGAGLGLALVKEFVEAMGGTVTAESTLGQGSCFTVHLRHA